MEDLIREHIARQEKMVGVATRRIATLKGAQLEEEA